MLRIIWDMDPGIDDALALLLALKSPELQVVGITTVAGNAPVEMTCHNARRVLECMGAEEIPVALGAGRPLRRSPSHAAHYHGPDGLGRCSLSAPAVEPHPARAWDFLGRGLHGAAGELTLLATGPLTNLARAFRRHPGLSGSLNRLVLMGGAYGLTPYGTGNRTPCAEFNIWQDPEAAHLVLASGMEITAVGLDVSLDPSTWLTREHLAPIKAAGGRAARLAAELVEYAVDNRGHCELHDPLALAVLIDPSLFEFRRVRTEVVRENGVERGRTRVLPRESDAGAVLSVASAVDGPRFVDLFLSRMMEERDG